MKFFSSFLLVAASIGAQQTIAQPIAALINRDQGTILLVNDFSQLASDVRTLAYAAGNYTGGGNDQYQPIQDAFTKVNQTAGIAYSDAMMAEPQGVDESNQLIAVVATNLQPAITTAVDALIAKRSLIEAAGHCAETANGLNLISYDHDTTSVFAIAPKLSPETLPSASPYVLRIDLDLRRGVVAFGGIPLAPLTADWYESDGSQSSRLV